MSRLLRERRGISSSYSASRLRTPDLSGLRTCKWFISFVRILRVLTASPSLTSRLMDPIKAIGKAPMFGNLISTIDGGVEILDDLNDHWTAKNHKKERRLLIEDLQDLAADKSIRVTILRYANSFLNFRTSIDILQWRRSSCGNRSILF